ncbi:MAG TPA: SDR family oxidoreductase [Dehalococcoidia bacterium]|nr:SDR family oxidoreductase [Dehalococcoidia bacterium]
MLNEFKLEGKAAIVTGAAKGIGKGIALALAEAGADIVAADIDMQGINQLAQEVQRLGRRYLPLATDVTDAGAVQKMIDGTVAHFGRLDILVNCAGYRGIDKALIPLPGLHPPREDIPDFYTPWSLDEWRSLIKIDLDSIFLCTQAAGQYMVKQNSGKIINIASSWAFSGMGSDLNVPYCTAKAAVVRFTAALAYEWARHNININAIAPGLVHTDLTQQIMLDHDAIRDKYMQRFPLGRLGTPREIGLLAVYLASPAANWMTGQVIYLNGGETIGK